jgi:hypothetical protein
LPEAGTFRHNCENYLYKYSYVIKGVCMTGHERINTAVEQNKQDPETLHTDYHEM